MTRKLTLTMIFAVAVAMIVAMAETGPAYAQDKVQSLRGASAIPYTPPAPMVKKQNTTGRMARAYRQQPPMIPHRIRGYQVDLKVNQCMGCHDWPANVEQGAPKISETHYRDRSGVALDYVSRTRWFCTQCHVPQANAKPLIKNDFRSALDVKK